MAIDIPEWQKLRPSGTSDNRGQRPSHPLLTDRGAATCFKVLTAFSLGNEPMPYLRSGGEWGQCKHSSSFIDFKLDKFSAKTSLGNSSLSMLPDINILRSFWVNILVNHSITVDWRWRRADLDFAQPCFLMQVLQESYAHLLKNQKEIFLGRRRRTFKYVI